MSRVSLPLPIPRAYTHTHVHSHTHVRIPLKGFSLEDVTRLSPSTPASCSHTHARALPHTRAHTLEGFQFGGHHASLSLYPFLVLTHTRARTLTHTCARP